MIPRRALAALVLAAACWGVGTVISKRAVEEFPPLTLLAIQLATSVVALGVAWALVRRRQPGGASASPADARLLDRLGLLNPGLAYALSLVGLTQITASLSVLIWAVEPILILGLAWWWLREPLTARLVILSLLALGGMALVIWSPALGGGAFGILVTLAGVGCCAVYSVLARAKMGDAPSTLRVVLGQQAWALGLALVLLGALALGGAIPREVAVDAARDPVTAVLGLAASVSAEGWLGALASGVVYYGLAYGFYLAALRDVPVSLAASAFYLIPVFGVAGGWALLGERLGPAQWLGGAVILLAVIAIARRREGVVEMGES